MFLPDLNNLAQQAMDIGRSNFPGSEMVTSAASKVGDWLSNGSNTNSQTETSSGLKDKASNDALAAEGDKTYTQNAQEVGNDSGGNSSGALGNVLAYPDNLGSDNVKHYTKFEIFVVKTENLNLLQGGSTSKPEYDDFAIPRNSQNIGDVKDKQVNKVKYTKIQEMIGLPIPDSLLADYSMMWSRAEGGFISGAVSLGDTMLDADARKKFEASSWAALGLGSGIANLASQIGMDGAETNLKLLTKRASNPRNEFLFDGVNNRSFNFQWRFIPKDAKESNTIKLILEKMKLYMHPELDESTAGKFYIFPAIFDITFMAGEKENEYLHRASSCSLTNMTVNHAAAGTASFFDGTNAPFAYEVVMQFTELEFLHRARFLTDNNTKGVAR